MRYTEKQLNFLRTHYPRMTRPELTEAFNKKFSTSIQVKTITSCLKNHNITSGRTGCFKSGHAAWNKGTRGLTKGNSSSFKKGLIPHNLKPIGHERICPKDGYIYIKVGDQCTINGTTSNYMHKHRWTWIQHHGPVPEGKLVSLIDGDPSNLELIDMPLRLLLNQHNVNAQPAELRPVLRSYAKLKRAVFNAERSL